MTSNSDTLSWYGELNYNVAVYTFDVPEDARYVIISTDTTSAVGVSNCASWNRIFIHKQAERKPERETESERRQRVRGGRGSRETEQRETEQRETKQRERRQRERMQREREREPVVGYQGFPS